MEKQTIEFSVEVPKSLAPKYITIRFDIKSRGDAEEEDKKKAPKSE